MQFWNSSTEVASERRPSSALYAAPQLLQPPQAAAAARPRRSSRVKHATFGSSEPVSAGGLQLGGLFDPTYVPRIAVAAPTVARNAAHSTAAKALHSSATGIPESTLPAGATMQPAAAQGPSPRSPASLPRSPLGVHAAPASAVESARRLPGAGVAPAASARSPPSLRPSSPSGFRGGAAASHTPAAAAPIYYQSGGPAAGFSAALPPSERLIAALSWIASLGIETDLMARLALGSSGLVAGPAAAASALAPSRQPQQEAAESDLSLILADGVFLSELAAAAETKAGNRIPVSALRLPGATAAAAAASASRRREAASVNGALSRRQGGAGSSGRGHGSIGAGFHGTGAAGHVITVLPGTVLPRTSGSSSSPPLQSLSAAHKNIELALSAFRCRPRIPGRHLHSAEQLRAGASALLAGELLEDLFRGYCYFNGGSGSDGGLGRGSGATGPSASEEAAASPSDAVPSVPPARPARAVGGSRAGGTTATAFASAAATSGSDGTQEFSGAQAGTTPRSATPRGAPAGSIATAALGPVRPSSSSFSVRAPSAAALSSGYRGVPPWAVNEQQRQQQHEGSAAPLGQHALGFPHLFDEMHETSPSARALGRGPGGTAPPAPHPAGHTNMDHAQHTGPAPHPALATSGVLGPRDRSTAAAFLLPPGRIASSSPSSRSTTRPRQQQQQHTVAGDPRDSHHLPTPGDARDLHSALRHRVSFSSPAALSSLSAAAERGGPAAMAAAAGTPTAPSSPQQHRPVSNGTFSGQHHGESSRLPPSGTMLGRLLPLLHAPIEPPPSSRAFGSPHHQQRQGSTSSQPRFNPLSLAAGSWTPAHASSPRSLPLPRGAPSSLGESSTPTRPSLQLQLQSLMRGAPAAGGMATPRSTGSSFLGATRALRRGSGSTLNAGEAGAAGAVSAPVSAPDARQRELVLAWLLALGLPSAPMLQHTLSTAPYSSPHLLDHPLFNGCLLAELVLELEPYLPPLGGPRPKQHRTHPRGVPEARANIEAALSALRCSGIATGVSTAPGSRSVEGEGRHGGGVPAALLWCGEEVLRGSEGVAWALLWHIYVVYSAAIASGAYLPPALRVREPQRQGWEEQEQQQALHAGSTGTGAAGSSSHSGPLSAPSLSSHPLGAAAEAQAGISAPDTTATAGAVSGAAQEEETWSGRAGVEIAPSASVAPFADAGGGGEAGGGEAAHLASVWSRIMMHTQQQHQQQRRQQQQQEQHHPLEEEQHMLSPPLAAEPGDANWGGEAKSAQPLPPPKPPHPVAGLLSVRDLLLADGNEASAVGTRPASVTGGRGGRAAPSDPSPFSRGEPGKWGSRAGSVASSTGASGARSGYGVSDTQLLSWLSRTLGSSTLGIELPGYQGVRPAPWDAQGAEGTMFSDGVLLARIVEVCEQARGRLRGGLPGIVDPARTGAAKLQNIRRVLEAMRSVPAMPLDYLWSELELREGDPEVTRGLLGQLRHLYDSHARV